MAHGQDAAIRTGIQEQTGTMGSGTSTLPDQQQEGESLDGHGGYTPLGRVGIEEENEFAAGLV